MVRVLCTELKTKKERPVCIACCRNFGRISKTTEPHYNRECHSCQEKRLTGKSTTSRWKRSKRYEYLKYRKSTCERCGFIPEHMCQLDVDHIDGNHANNDVTNLATLCANCHRYKTQINKEYHNQYTSHLRIAK